MILGALLAIAMLGPVYAAVTAARRSYEEARQWKPRPERDSLVIPGEEPTGFIDAVGRGRAQFVLFFVLAALGVLIWAWLAFSRTLEPLRWPTVSGTITGSEVVTQEDEEGRERIAVDIRYAYPYAGREYEGSGYRPSGDMVDDQLLAGRIVGENPVGAEVVVYVNPDDSAESWLHPTPNYLLLTLVCGSLTFLMGTLFIVGVTFLRVRKAEMILPGVEAAGKRQAVSGSGVRKQGQ